MAHFGTADVPGANKTSPHRAIKENDCAPRACLASNISCDHCTASLDDPIDHFQKMYSKWLA